MKRSPRLSTIFTTILIAFPIIASPQPPADHNGGYEGHQLPDHPPAQHERGKMDQQRPQGLGDQHDGNIPPMPLHIDHVQEELNALLEDFKKSGNRDGVRRIESILKDLESKPDMMSEPPMEHNFSESNPSDFQKRRNNQQSEQPKNQRSDRGERNENSRFGNFDFDGGDRLGERIIRHRILLDRLVEGYEKEKNEITVERKKPNPNTAELDQRKAMLLARRSEALDRFRETAPEMLTMLNRAEELVSRFDRKPKSAEGFEHLTKIKDLLENLPEDDEKLYNKLSTILKESPLPSGLNKYKKNKNETGEANQHLERINREIQGLERRLEHLKVEKKYLEEGAPPLEDY